MCLFANAGCGKQKVWCASSSDGTSTTVVLRLGFSSRYSKTGAMAIVKQSSKVTCKDAEE